MKARTWDGENMIYLSLKQMTGMKCNFLFLDDTLTFGWNYDYVGEVEWPFMLETGVKDKHGKLIFDGDIIKGHDDFIYRIWKEKGGFVINVHVDKFKNDIQMNHPFPSQPLADEQTVSYVESSCMVIGNIYENPELLTNQ